MVDLPAPEPAQDEVVVEVRAISVNRGELHQLDTASAGWRPDWDSRRSRSCARTASIAVHSLESSMSTVRAPDRTWVAGKAVFTIDPL